MLQVRRQPGVRRGSQTPASIGDRGNYRRRHSKRSFGHPPQRVDLGNSQPSVGSHVEDPCMAIGDEQLHGCSEVFRVKELCWSVAISVA